MALVPIPSTVPWTLVVTLGGVDVSARLTGPVRVELEESTARIAEFSLRPAAQAVSLANWLGAAVSIDYVRGAQTLRRFTGQVFLPRLDPDTKVIRFQCTDNRQAKLEALDRAAIEALLPGSRWSADVFDAEAEGLRYAEDRLSTLPASLDLARDGSTWRLTDWAMPVATDFEFEAVMDRSLQVETAQLSDLVNEIRLKFDYRFVRRRHITQAFQWAWTWPPGAPSDFCTWFADTTELPDKDMIQQAAERGGWTPQPLSYSWAELPPSSGPPVCGNFDVGWINPGVPVVLGASWVAAARTSQYVTEHYELALRAPNSIAQFGEQVRHERGSAETPHDLDDWETAPAIGIPDGFTEDAWGHWIRDYADREQLDIAIETMLHAARVRILDSHRRNTVTFDWPDCVDGLDVGSAVAVQALGVQAEGRVRQLVEQFDLERETVRSTISLAVSQGGTGGAVSETPLLAPEPPDTTPVPIEEE